MNQKKYYLQLFIICTGTLFLSHELAKLNTPYFLSTHYWIPTLFFLSTTFLINKLLTNGDKASKEFVFKTLASSMARLLGCMIFVFIYSLVNKSGALAFTCHFMIAYLVFTVFELAFLLKFIKQPSN